MRTKLTVLLEYISVVVFLTFNRAVMHDCCENTCQRTSDGCEQSSARSSALALVPYDEKSLVVPDFYRDERRLRFGDLTVTVRQNWRDVGVAAVVWDAVSFVAFDFGFRVGGRVMVRLNVFLLQWMLGDFLLL